MAQTIKTKLLKTGMLYFVMILFLGVITFSCKPKVNVPNTVAAPLVVSPDSLTVKPWLYAYIVEKDIPIKAYFRYMDSVARVYDTLVAYHLTAHIIVRTNPWILDTLVSTDYYNQRKKGVFIYDQKEFVALKKGDTLYMPTDTIANQIIEKQAETVLDVNIPEMKLRVIEGSDTVGTFLVRVGQNRINQWANYEKMSKLRTKTGSGKIIHTYFKSAYLDPVTGQTHDKTKRDDGDSTFMALMPWLEPQINGENFGQLIHPTTNENTLGKAYSNGCIGVGEGDMWRVYYYAPIGTRVRIRYNLNVKDDEGRPIRLKDIYGKKPKVG